MTVRLLTYSQTLFESALRRFESARGGLRRGWSGPYAAATVLAGVVVTQDDAQSALLAAIAGAGIIVLLAADRALVSQFIEDLRHVGPIEWIAPTPDAPAVPDDVAALAAQLARGATIRDAARACGMSQRTAARRLASQRSQLGLSTNTELVARLADIARRPQQPPASTL